ncbi:SDR family NAD(P)-dependent oxidoreductase [Streptomyces sp. NPDC003006]
MRSVVVTGASSGIGRATALELSGRGYDVIGTVRSDAKAESLVTAALERGRSLRTVVLEVADEAACEEVFAAIGDMTDGGPWAVVNNAGVELLGAVEDVDCRQARHVLEVNLLAPIRICRLVLPAMRRRGAGRIVNVTSHAGLVASPFNGWYAASKHGVEALSDSLRMETARDGVHVSLVEPGFHETAMVPEGERRLSELGEMKDSAYSDAYAETLRRLRRLRPFRPADDVARVICRALESRRPRARYLVGKETPLTRLALFTPQWTMDRYLRAFTGLR